MQFLPKFMISSGLRHTQVQKLLSHQWATAECVSRPPTPTLGRTLIPTTAYGAPTDGACFVYLNNIATFRRFKESS